jgi:hypothetical protein
VYIYDVKIDSLEHLERLPFPTDKLQNMLNCYRTYSWCLSDWIHLGEFKETSGHNRHYENSVYGINKTTFLLQRMEVNLPDKLFGNENRFFLDRASVIEFLNRCNDKKVREEIGKEVEQFAHLKQENREKNSEQISQ